MEDEEDDGSGYVEDDDEQEMSTVIRMKKVYKKMKAEMLRMKEMKKMI